MPIHDWTRVPAGLFHHFHQDWSVEIARALNRGLLPSNLSALVEQRSGAVETDVLAIEEELEAEGSAQADNGSVATMAPPRASIVRRSTNEMYAARANRIVIRHHLGRIVSVIEIVSPGNKSSRPAIRDFVDKSADFLRNGVHLMVVDLFPPTPRDPAGIHKLIWDEVEEEEFEFPPGKDRLLVSYQAGEEKVAYIEPVGVGDVLPEISLILTTTLHVPVPLESTYQTAWDASPAAFRHSVETGETPEHLRLEN